ncbi:hypothetical protein A0H81_12517 [Grifola frondosa]|uniref:Uncharacterized protein n=1 Tax=Grifola frondosa TaxID=5627 RepID=A0A1C7LRX5_GRIFR|nr:hypothetical protein A0H81_12517 [Grifola frondosa]
MTPPGSLQTPIQTTIMGNEVDDPFLDFEPIDKNHFTNTPLVESPTSLEREDLNPVPPSLSFEEWMGGITEGATGPGVPGGDPLKEPPRGQTRPMKKPRRAMA